MANETAPSSPRRSFLTRLNTGAAALAALTLSGVAKAQSKAAARFEPARHEKDDWMDNAAKHRLIFDPITAEAVAQSLAFTGNFIRVNQSDYGLTTADSAVIIIVRHRSVAFGYNDAMWAKYGVAMQAQNNYVDPKTKEAAKLNVMNSPAYSDAVGNRGTTFDAAAKLGVQVGVCAVATRNMANNIAKSTGGNADEVFKELTSNLVANGRMVPAGIIAVNRAQERGYTLAQA